MSDSGPSKPPIRRPRKTPDQRGAVGWWAYRTMVALGLSDAQIAARAGIGSAAIRKFMGSPNGELGAESRTAMLAYYREVAARTMTPIDEPPVGFIVGASGDAAPQPSPDVSAYLTRIDALVEQLALDRKLIRDLVAALQPAAYDAADQEAAALGLGSRDPVAPEDGPADGPPADVHPTSSHPGR